MKKKVEEYDPLEWTEFEDLFGNIIRMRRPGYEKEKRNQNLQQTSEGSYQGLLDSRD